VDVLEIIETTPTDLEDTVRMLELESEAQAAIVNAQEQAPLEESVPL
jgi:hypothetical protein